MPEEELNRKLKSKVEGLRHLPAGIALDGEKAWLKLEPQLHQRPRRNKAAWLVAASIFLVMAVGWLSYDAVMKPLPVKAFAVMPGEKKQPSSPMQVLSPATEMRGAAQSLGVDNSNTSLQQLLVRRPAMAKLVVGQAINNGGATAKLVVGQATNNGGVMPAKQVQPLQVLSPATEARAANPALSVDDNTNSGLNALKPLPAATSGKFRIAHINELYAEQNPVQPVENRNASKGIAFFRSKQTGVGDNDVALRDNTLQIPRKETGFFKVILNISRDN